MLRGTNALWTCVCALLLCACDSYITSDQAPDEIPIPPASEDGDTSGFDFVSYDGEHGEKAPDVDPPVAWENPANPFGIGLVNTGDTLDWNRTVELAGAGGHIKMTFAGVTPEMTSAPQNWINTVQAAYNRDLVPVVRIGPNWGDMNIRALSDDAEHLHYDTIASTYAAVIASLPRRADWPLIIELHNEPDLCYEWKCSAGDAKPHPNATPGWMHYTDIAAEYASFLRDVTSHVEAIGDPRILLINGGLAPGGARQCRCDSDEYQPGITSVDFINAMKAEVPDVFEHLDGWATHPYPAQGAGWGFFESYESSNVGLHYYENELAAVGVDLPVYITETGWTTSQGANGSREDIASWTVQAYENDWLADPRVVGIMPFMLRDAAWDSFSWLQQDGAPQPVFSAVKALRCELEVPSACGQ
jgi:hypothetical protein